MQRTILYLYEYVEKKATKCVGFVKVLEKEYHWKLVFKIPENVDVLGQDIFIFTRRGEGIKRECCGPLVDRNMTLERKKETSPSYGEQEEIVGICVGNCAASEGGECEFPMIAQQEEHEDSKLENIMKNHEAMYPFEDDEFEACVQLAMEDFSDFPKDYWKMSSNSFLLQGYYNFRHVLLGKTSDEWFLGIPGQFHRRDQFLAERFGFYRFKGIHKRQERLGDFGYWLKKIEPFS